MNDMVSLGVGSVAGAVVSELLKVVIEEAKMVLAFRSVSMELASTMDQVLPVIKAIETLQDDEVEDLNDMIGEARVLVRKCSQVKRWNLPSKAKYTRKIEEINKKMLKFCQIQLQLIMLRNQRLIMRHVGVRREKSESSLLSCDPPSERLSNWEYDRLSPWPSDRLSCILPFDTLEAIDSHLESINKKLHVFSVSPPDWRDLCSVPKLDKVLVGLDLPLMEVKKKLLDDDDSVVSLVVSAPPGCGKTTFVTQLCHDDDIIEKFEYIFFCVMSSAPTFRTTVQNLLQHNGYETPTFENDSQAVDGLRNLLEELKEEGPILLVLDDVCQGAESFLHKFQINILNFKILVTSQFEFPSFGPACHMNPLGDEDAKSLLIEKASLHHLSFKNEDPFQEILQRCYGFPFLIEEIGVGLVKKAIREGVLQVESESEEETTFNNPPHVSNVNTKLLTYQKGLPVARPIKIKNKNSAQTKKHSMAQLEQEPIESDVHSKPVTDTWTEEIVGDCSSDSTTYETTLSNKYDLLLDNYDEL